MLFDRKSLMEVRNHLAEHHEKVAKALRELNFAPFMLFETQDNAFLGEVMGLKGDDILIKVLAARVVDHKVRNLSSKAFKRRTYPLPLSRITSSKELKETEVPLYINFKYLSPQFKNRYLK